MLKKFRLLLIALAGIAALALAQQEPAPDSSDDAPDTAEQAPGDDGAGFNRDADEDVFIPTEEIPADEEVTFPVDI